MRSQHTLHPRHRGVRGGTPQGTVPSTGQRAVQRDRDFWAYLILLVVGLVVLVTSPPARAQAVSSQVILVGVDRADAYDNQYRSYVYNALWAYYPGVYFDTAGIHALAQMFGANNFKVGGSPSNFVINQGHVNHCIYRFKNGFEPGSDFAWCH